VSRCLVALFALVAVGCATAPLTPDQEREVRGIVADVKRDAYPELRERDVAVATFSEDGAFFQSDFAVLSALMGEREYTISVNPRAYELGVPKDALHGVLAHELAHTFDYERRDRAGLVALVPAVLFAEDNTRFERWTDLQAIARGYGPSLFRYRMWQEKVLTPEQWAQKRATYYGPHELQLLIDARARCPQVFYAFLSEPPADAHDIATHCP
jgi:hypothetical protein